ncbi:MAG: hypothetical protein IH798_01650 [Gemmatimonadetes bacterium]|nr:hypothetical protein [Gemmatimonadota bacterium]
MAGLPFHQLAKHFGAVENLAGADRRLGLPADLGQGVDKAGDLGETEDGGGLSYGITGGADGELFSIDADTVIESVRKTNRGVIVEEGWPFAGVGAQLVDTIQREAFDHLDAPLLRVTGADVPMPYNKKLERAAKPNPQKVIDAVKQVTYTA